MDAPTYKELSDAFSVISRAITAEGDESLLIPLNQLDDALRASHPDRVTDEQENDAMSQIQELVSQGEYRSIYDILTDEQIKQLAEDFNEGRE
jgi:hypothetical protein